VISFQNKFENHGYIYVNWIFDGFFLGTTMVIFQNWTFDYLIVVTVNFHIRFDAQQGLVHFGVYRCFFLGGGFGFSNFYYVNKTWNSFPSPIL